jgi:hypothetical protein
LLLVWICFVVKGMFFAWIFPVWEGFDEPAHFSTVQQWALEGEAPDRQFTKLTREVEQSLLLLPLPASLQKELPAGTTHDAYWRLPEEERGRRQQRLREVASQRGGEEPGAGAGRNYESQQPPLYYLLMAPWYWWSCSWGLVEKVWWLRLVSLLLASLAIPLGYWWLRSFWGEGRLAIGSLALLVAMPGPMMSWIRVSNESLTIVLATALLVLLGRRSAVGAGVVLAAGLLTKAYFLALALAVGLLLGPSWRRSWPALAIPLGAAGGLYWANYAATGSLTGEQNYAGATGLAGWELVRTMRAVDWRNAIDSAFQTHLWVGNWSFLLVRSWMYHVMGVIYVLAGGGLVRLVYQRGGLPPRWLLGTALLFGGCFLVGMFHHVLVIYAVHGQSATTGWYINCLAVAEAALLARGLVAWGVPVRSVFVGLTVMLAALELFGTHFYLIPFYAGFTEHRDSGFVAALDYRLLANGGWRVLGERLLVNRPEWVSLPLLAGTWAAYLVAVAAPIGLAWRVRPGRAG